MVVKIPLRVWVSGATIYPFVFLFKGHTEHTKAHELVHIRQQRRWWKYGGPLGLLAWLFLYAFVLPVGWNPWRWKWEYEAYKEGSKFGDFGIERKLRRFPYMLWWHSA